MELSVEQMKRIIEANLLMNREPLTPKKLAELFTPEENVTERAVVDTLTLLAEDYRGRGVELVEVATGYRFQVCSDLAPWIQRTMAEKPQRYSRALLETLALIAYRQPITRAEIEEIRGVVVSTHIIRTLEEREWIRVIGHRDVPGRPALFATTKQFLNDLNLKSLGELPTLAELQDLDSLDGKMVQLSLDMPAGQTENASDESAEVGAASGAETEDSDQSVEKEPSSDEILSAQNSEENSEVSSDLSEAINSTPGTMSSEENSLNGEDTEASLQDRPQDEVSVAEEHTEDSLKYESEDELPLGEKDAENSLEDESEDELSLAEEDTENSLDDESERELSLAEEDTENSLEDESEEELSLDEENTETALLEELLDLDMHLTEEESETETMNAESESEETVSQEKQDWQDQSVQSTVWEESEQSEEEWSASEKQVLGEGLELKAEDELTESYEDDTYSLSEIEVI